MDLSNLLASSDDQKNLYYIIPPERVPADVGPVILFVVIRGIDKLIYGYGLPVARKEEASLFIHQPSLRTWMSTKPQAWVTEWINQNRTEVEQVRNQALTLIESLETVFHDPWQGYHEELI